MKSRREWQQHDEWAAEYTGTKPRVSHAVSMSCCGQAVGRVVGCIRRQGRWVFGYFKLSSDRWNKTQRKIAELAAIEHSAYR